MSGLLRKLHCIWSVSTELAFSVDCVERMEAQSWTNQMEVENIFFDLVIQSMLWYVQNTYILF